MNDVKKSQSSGCKQTGAKMDRLQHMKSFISAAADYTKHPSEANISILQRNLGVLGVSLDLSIFDPGSCIAAEFYVSLHELMNSLASHTQLIWNALEVLENASKNTAARQALIHIYKFTPRLAGLLETNLTTEKRVRVLKLLQELTYGVKLLWEEVHLPYLISLLTQWVAQSTEDEVISLSLGILVNLCYKNLPAVYTLMRTVDTKSFTRRLVKTASTRKNVRVQCCKLMIILEMTHHDLEGKQLLEFVSTTFSTLVSALNDRDVLLLRHIVDFFHDVRENAHSKSVILTYPRYAEDTKKILGEIQTDSDPESVSLVMEFLLSLVNLKLPALLPLYPTCVRIAMSWVLADQVCSKALALIRTVVLDSRDSEISAEVLSEVNLSVLMLVLNGEDEKDSKTERRSAETQSRLTELMQLLQEMVRLPALKHSVMECFDEKTMRRLLAPILEQDDASAAGEWPGNLFNDPATTLYVYALGLTVDSAANDPTWLTLQSELRQKKQIQMIVALALFTADTEVKTKALQLIASFPLECVSSVARCMTELQPLVLVQNATGTVGTSIDKNSTLCPAIERAPLFSFDLQRRLDSFLSGLEETYQGNKNGVITISAVMELYDYKLAAMRHAERATQVKFEAANNHAISLQHRLAQVVAESSRLHQLFFHSQQSLEGAQEEKAGMSKKLREIPRLEKTVSTLRKELETSANTSHALKIKMKQLETESAAELAKRNEVQREMEQLISRRDQMIEEQGREMMKYQQTISALKQQHEQAKKQSEEEVQRLVGELAEFRQMRDMIAALTSKKIAEQNTTT